MKLVLLALIIAFPAGRSWSGEVPDRHGRVAARLNELDPEVRAMTEKVLRRMNTDYEAMAKKGLLAKGERFDHARVETTGVASNDDTNLVDPDLFDRQIKPSFSAIENMTLMQRAAHEAMKLIDPARIGGTLPDVAEYTKAATGETTPRARLKLKAYRDAEINEIVAHSWGTELIYAAILNGEIRPPKKLIVVGVPDDDKWKWMLLAAWTGTQVHWVRADNDRVAKDGAERIASKVTTDFESRWKALCGGHVPNTRTCRPHGRLPEQLIVDEIGSLPGLTGHDRREYYEVLKQKHVIEGSVLALRSAETVVKLAEIELVESLALAEANKQARILVERVREQKAIARRDHDERLKNARVDLARRFCAAPGSISQAELDALPKPYARDDDVPPDLRGCEETIYSAISRGVKADALIYQIPVPLQGVRPSPPVEIVARIPFSSNLTDLSGLSERACSSAGRVEGAERLVNPRNPYFFRREVDDEKIDELSARLDDCSRRLFHKLVETIRAGQGAAVTGRWLRDRVNDYSSRPIYAEPSGGAPRRGGRCEDYGNIRCP